MKTLIVIFVILALLWLILKRVVFFRVIRVKPARDNAASADGAEEMARDPVCGNYVPLRTALRSQRQGRIEYFCSTACREKYVKALRG